MKKIIEFIFSENEILTNPPVLLDIGASGKLHPEWEELAKYSICIAFDADDREISFLENVQSDFRKLYVVNRIVTEKEKGEQNFYLTKSPYCSSLLKPNTTNLEDWVFKSLFDVERVVKLKTASLPKTLKELNISRIDWFKTDSQGTDLVLFLSLGELADQTIVAEFEPGIIDAYEGEDKLYDLFEEMEQHPFWLSSLDVQGTKRMNLKLLADISDSEKNILEKHTTTSACWANARYFNSFTSLFGKREYLLGVAFAVLQKQYAFAVELCVRGEKLFSDSVFAKIKQEIIKNLRQNELPQKSTFKKQLVNFINRG